MASLRIQRITMAKLAKSISKIVESLASRVKNHVISFIHYHGRHKTLILQLLKLHWNVFFCILHTISQKAVY